jgi:hypothetical protein
MMTFAPFNLFVNNPADAPLVDTIDRTGNQCLPIMVGSASCVINIFTKSSTVAFFGQTNFGFREVFL